MSREELIENLPDELMVLLQEIDDIELVLSHFLNAGYIGFPGARHQSRVHQRGLVTFGSALAIYNRDKMISTGIPYYKADTEELLGYWLREKCDYGDEIQFWGYGLPSADYHKFSFLLTALRNTKTYCTVVDHRKDGSETNLMKLARLHYGDESGILRVETDGLVDNWSIDIGT